MVERWSRWFDEHRTLPDALLALALFLLSATTLGQSGAPVAVELLMTVALLLPLLFRRTAPEAMVATTAAVCLLQLLLLAQPLMADLVVLVAVHTAAAHIPDRRWGLTAAGAGAFGSVLAGLRWFGRDQPSVLVLGVTVGVVAVTAALVLGRWQRERRERTADQLAAAQERTVLLEREHQQRLQVSAAAERARIARELHDIVAHSLSVVIVQADGAAAASEADPSVAPAALATIADTGREALAEMRRMIGVLRTGGDLDPDAAAHPGGRGAGPTDPGYAPMPQLADIPELVAQVGRTGLDVTLTLPEPLPEVPAGLGLTVYRVIQESLTNVLKHAGPDPSVDVRVAATPSRLLVVVTDDGRGAAATAWAPVPAAPGAPDQGHGLTGMRERVLLQGGTVQAAPRVGGRVPGRRRTAAARPGVGGPGGGGSPVSGSVGAPGIRVALVDDQHLVRSGFRMLIDAQPDMRVVGEAGSGADAVALAGRTAAASGDPGDPGIDVVLMDVRMPGMDGVQACGQVLARPVAPRVLMLTTFDLDEYVWAALRAGASGFLLKDARPEELLGAIRAVAAGDAVVAPSATRRLIEQFSHTLPTPSARAAGADRIDRRLEVLTAREREVLALIATGASNTEIAGRLVLAEATVKTHVGRLLAKLDVRDRVGLVVLAYETGLAGSG